MNKKIIRVILPAVIGAAVGLFIAIWMQRGNLINWPELIISWLLTSLVFATLYVALFWLTPSLACKIYEAIQRN